MLMLKYFRPKEGLSDPKGALLSSLSERAIIIANHEVQEVVTQSVNLKRGKYSCYAIDTFL